MSKNLTFAPSVSRIGFSVENEIPSVGAFVKLFQERIAKRCSVEFSDAPAEFTLFLSLDPAIGENGFRIQPVSGGCVIAGADSLGLLYGLGKYLHTSGYSAAGFQPSLWEGTSVPTSTLRGIQLDTHFCNFYHMAPAEALSEYVEDLALWGINYIDVVFPLIDLMDWADPEVNKITGQIRTIYQTAKALGLKVGLEVVPNQDFIQRNEAVKATPNRDPRHRKGNNGHNICPNRDGAMDYILTHTYGRVFRHLKENDIVMDFLCFWPYDEGGCGCDLCAPWGANGYLKSSRAIWEVAKAYLPDIKVILSTWVFDTPEEGEWAGLAKYLEQGNDWIDYILADSHDDFPRYPLERGVPGGLPLINYPEISMWGLYPWGGYGANPLPDRFEALWHQVKGVVGGGIAYSEGIFDDINKVVVSQFYWNGDTTADQTLREYISYEYSPAVYENVREAIRYIERNQTLTKHIVQGKLANPNADLPGAKKAAALLRDADSRLPGWAKQAWRWRILILRSELDALRYSRVLELREQLPPKSTWTDVLRGCEAAKTAMAELADIYHSNLDADDSIHPMYRHVRPALKEL